MTLGALYLCQGHPRGRGPEHKDFAMEKQRARSVIFGLSLGLAVALLLAGCMGRASGPGLGDGLAIQWEECMLSSPGTLESVPARCGTLSVPEDRDDPSGRQIPLYVALVPAVSRNPRPDPLFVLAGGPGQAATETYPAILFAAFGGIHQGRDIVLVDQRGTGQSNPLECKLPEGDDVSEQEVIEALQACPSTLDADPRLYTTDIAVRDLDQVRAALGYERINLYGASYGTRVALAYLRRYPTRARTVVLDAVVSADFRVHLTAGRDGARAMDMLFDRCRAEPACREAFPDLQVEFQSLLSQLEAEPVTVRVPDPLSGEAVDFTFTRPRFASMVYAMLYSPELASLLPLSIHTAYVEGDYAPLLAQAGSADAGIYRGLLYAVLCTEDIPFIAPQEAATLNKGSYFGDMSAIQREVCEAWPRGELPPDYGEPVRSDVPVLLLSGEADPVTPPQYAEQVTTALGNSLHLVAPEMGHSIIIRGCVPRVVADFVDAASVEGLDTACVQEIAPPPFFVRLTGPEP